MNLDAIAATLTAFIARHNTTFSNLGSRQTQVLELAAIVGVTQHYVAAGFTIDIRNPRGSGSFVIKASTRGHPADYSRIRCSKGSDAVELHANLMVRSSRDRGVYCVDVGIAEVDRVPTVKGGEKWVCIESEALRSFVEVKKLVVYPMLLAQFLGIVHEIRPEFMETPAPIGFGDGDHLPPTLVALGHFSANSRDIIDSFTSRGYTFLVAANFDMRLAWCRTHPDRSPFFSAADDTDLGGAI